MDFCGLGGLAAADSQLAKIVLLSFLAPSATLPVPARGFSLPEGDLCQAGGRGGGGREREGVLTVAWHKVNSLWQEPEEQVACMLKSLGKKHNPLPGRSAKELLYWEISPCSTLGSRAALARLFSWVAFSLPDLTLLSTLRLLHVSQAQLCSPVQQKPDALLPNGLGVPPNAPLIPCAYLSHHCPQDHCSIIILCVCEGHTCLDGDLVKIRDHS